MGVTSNLHRGRKASVRTWAWLLLLGACDGTIGAEPVDWGQDASGGAGQVLGGSGGSGAGGTGSGTGGVGGTGGAGGGATNACGDPAMPARAVLATEQQYRNTLSDVLGEEAVADIDEQGELLFEVIDRPRMGTGRLDRVLRMAESATESLRGRTAQVLGCADLSDATCIRDGLTRLGRRAYKRPLTATEQTELMALYEESVTADMANLPPPATLDGPPPQNAILCAGEYNTCSLPPGITATVWYGREDGWVARTGMSGDFACGNELFGDPFMGDAKSCYYIEGEPSVDTGPTAAVREDGVLLAMTAMLVSPSTLYRTEFSGGSGGLNAYEQAAAIAALLLDSVPDESLLTAATDGSLLTAAGLDAQLSRLLQLPRVRDHLTDVLLHAFNVHKLFDSPKDPGVFPNYTPALQSSMYEETRRVIDDVLWGRQAPLTELLTTRQSFVNADLASIYGIPYNGAGDEFVPVTLPETRSGILTHPSLMSALSRTDHTSVVARGLFVRGAILCASKIPAPPAAVFDIVQMQIEADATQAELAEYRANSPACAGCHSQFDRFGLTLERFDPIGADRPASEMPVDLTGLLDFQGTVSGSSELIAQIAESPKFIDCMTERMLGYALSEARTTGSVCIPDDIASTLHGGQTDIATLLGAVIRHPDFALRGSEN